MQNYDIFNGDADGLCALQQLRLDDPRDSILVTGIKRDISLVSRVDARAGDRLTVLDISLEKNLDAVQKNLQQGAEILYIDHHRSGDIPAHPALEAVINTHAEVCTSLLVNGRLRGRFGAWAVAGAFGDNLDNSAAALAATLGLSGTDTGRLKELGICLNYNGYGLSVAELHFPPDQLFRELQPYENPLDFLVSDSFAALQAGYEDDMGRAAALGPWRQGPGYAVYRLPAAPWAGRVSGVFANELAQDHPDRAHAMISPLADGQWRVSVRAPLSRREGADELCSGFPTGGGRKAAAGINALADEQLGVFIDALADMYGR